MKDLDDGSNHGYVAFSKFSRRSLDGVLREIKCLFEAASVLIFAK